MSDRHARQARLREVGERGQKRIEAATAIVTSRGVAGEVESRYLSGAGFGKIVVLDGASATAALAVDPSSSVEVREHCAREGAEGPALPAGFLVGDPSARAVGEGAYRALVAIRAALASDRG